MRERHLQVRRTARYYTLGDERAPEVWVVCHGYAQRPDRFLPRFEAIAGPERLLVAPEALNRFYPEPGVGPHGPDSPVAPTWMTRDDREAEISDYVAYLDRLMDEVAPAAGSPRVVALGFSQGAATVARWAMLGGARLDRLVLWGSGFPPDPEPADHARRLAGLSPVLVVGSRDPALTPEGARRDRRRMADAGVPVTLLEYDGGHRIEATALKRLLAELG